MIMGCISFRLSVTQTGWVYGLFVVKSLLGNMANWDVTDVISVWMIMYCTLTAIRCWGSSYFKECLPPLREWLTSCSPSIGPQGTQIVKEKKSPELMLWPESVLRPESLPWSWRDFGDDLGKSLYFTDEDLELQWDERIYLKSHSSLTEELGLDPMFLSSILFLSPERDCHE